jgi:uncharacterized protein YwgA
VSEYTLHVAIPDFIAYNKRVKNMLNINPGMSVRDISRVALELGCEVIHENSPGEISLKHPAIGSSLLLSSAQHNPGAEFAFWAKSLISNSKDRFTMINFDTHQGRVAKALQKMSYPDTQVVLAELAAQLEPSLTSKQVADSVSHLIRRGYVERVEPGRYKTTEILNQAVETYLVDESKADTLKAPVKAEEEKAVEKPVKIRRRNRETSPEIDPVKLEGLIDRLEKAVENLEKTAREFQDYDELRDAMAIIEKTLAKRKQR